MCGGQAGVGAVLFNEDGVKHAGQQQSKKHTQRNTRMASPKMKLMIRSPVQHTLYNKRAPRACYAHPARPRITARGKHAAGLAVFKVVPFPSPAAVAGNALCTC